jgi:hypothetical protein
MRDYIAQCDACERPLHVRIDQDRIVRRSILVDLARDLPVSDPVSTLLDTKTRRAFWSRVVWAAMFVCLAAGAAILLGASRSVVIGVVLVAVIPAAMWAPALAASIEGYVRGALTQTRRRGVRRSDAPVELSVARWDQWIRETRIRERDQLANPELVLRELERVLDDRELRRVRAMAASGEVPSSSLEDLLRYRRTWRHVA